jgi:hypothetical protein
MGRWIGARTGLASDRNRTGVMLSQITRSPIHSSKLQGTLRASHVSTSSFVLWLVIGYDISYFIIAYSQNVCISCDCISIASQAYLEFHMPADKNEIQSMIYTRNLRLAARSVPCLSMVDGRNCILHPLIPVI